MVVYINFSQSFLSISISVYVTACLQELKSHGEVRCVWSSKRKCISAVLHKSMGRMGPCPSQIRIPYFSLGLPRNPLFEWEIDVFLGLWDSLKSWMPFPIENKDISGKLHVSSKPSQKDLKTGTALQVYVQRSLPESCLWMLFRLCRL